MAWDRMRRRRTQHLMPTKSRYLSTMEAVDDVASYIRASTGGLLTRSGVARGPAPSVPQFEPGQPSQ
ncbi:TPA: hypothetical protein ACH3X3_005141 [Trebouxia sp. C0006]